MNKYERKAEHILDFHGYTIADAKAVLNELMGEKNYSHVRIITGKGAFRETGPILRTFVREYLVGKGVKVNPAKLEDGGEGAWEVFL